MWQKRKQRHTLYVGRVPMAIVTNLTEYNPAHPGLPEGDDMLAVERGAKWSVKRSKEKPLFGAVKWYRATVLGPTPQQNKHRHFQRLYSAKKWAEQNAKV